MTQQERIELAAKELVTQLGIVESEPKFRQAISTFTKEVLLLKNNGRDVILLCARRGPARDPIKILIQVRGNKGIESEIMLSTQRVWDAYKQQIPSFLPQESNNE